MLAVINPFGVAILVAIIVGPIYLFLHYRRSTWTGVVTDKHFREGADEDGGTTYAYHLQIKKNGATKAHDHSVNAETYDRFTVGDAITKRPGKVGLVKI